jgi:hypothetical protein
MPTYEITYADGTTLRLEGDAPPQDSDVSAAYNQYAQGRAAEGLKATGPFQDSGTPGAPGVAPTSQELIDRSRGPQLTPTQAAGAATAYTPGTYAGDRNLAQIEPSLRQQDLNRSTTPGQDQPITALSAYQFDPFLERFGAGNAKKVADFKKSWDTAPTGAQFDDPHAGTVIKTGAGTFQTITPPKPTGFLENAYNASAHGFMGIDRALQGDVSGGINEASQGVAPGVTAAWQAAPAATRVASMVASTAAPYAAVPIGYAGETLAQIQENQQAGLPVTTGWDNPTKLAQIALAPVINQVGGEGLIGKVPIGTALATGAREGAGFASANQGLTMLNRQDQGQSLIQPGDVRNAALMTLGGAAARGAEAGLSRPVAAMGDQAPAVIQPTGLPQITGEGNAPIIERGAPLPASEPAPISLPSAPSAPPPAPPPNAGVQVLQEAAAKTESPGLANIVAEGANQAEGKPGAIQAAANNITPVAKLPTIAETVQKDALPAVDKPIAPALYTGRQELPPGTPPLFTGESFKLTEGIDGHPAGSNVSRTTLESAGFHVPKTPETPHGEIQSTPLSQLDQRSVDIGPRNPNVSRADGTPTPFEDKMIADWKKQIEDQKKTQQSEQKPVTTEYPGVNQSGVDVLRGNFSGPIGDSQAAGISKPLAARLGVGTALGVAGWVSGDTPEQKSLNAFTGATLGLLAGHHIVTGLENLPKLRDLSSEQVIGAIKQTLAGANLPVMSKVAPASADKMIELASARDAATAQANSLKYQVLGPNYYKDAPFAKKLGAILTEEQLLGKKRDLEAAAAKATTLPEAQQLADELSQVVSTIGRKDSPFKTQADFQAALADPEMQAAIERHKALVEPILRENQIATGGDIRGAGPNTGAFINTKAVFRDSKGNLIDKPLPIGSASKGNLQNPLQRGSRTNKGFAGTASEYETDYNALVDHAVTANWQEAKKAQAYKALEAEGKGVMLQTGEDNPMIGGVPSIRYEAQRFGMGSEAGSNYYLKQLEADGKGQVLPLNAPDPMLGGVAGKRFEVETPGGGQGALWVKPDAADQVEKTLALKDSNANFWVTPDIEREFRSVMNTDGKFSSGALAERAAKLATGAQVLGYTDLFSHAATVTGAIVSSPGGASVMHDLARIMPGVGYADAVKMMLEKGQQVARGDPELLADIAKITNIGAMRPTWGETDLMRTYDRTARLVLNDMFDNLVKRGTQIDTPANRRAFINQAGQYNPKLMTPLMAWVKGTGLAPFVVASKTGTTLALRRMLPGILLNPGVEAASKGSSAYLRATQVAGVFGSVIALPFGVNMMTTGRPTGRTGVPIGAIDTGKNDANGKMIIIDVAQWSGLRRGLLRSGIQATTTGLMEGRPFNTWGHQAAQDIIGGQTAPYTGPVLQAAKIAMTGTNFQGYQEAKNVTPVGQSDKTIRQDKENIKSAVMNLIPTIHTISQGNDAMIQAGKTNPTALTAATDVGKQLLGPTLGVKFQSPTADNKGALEVTQDARFDTEAKMKAFVNGIADKVVVNGQLSHAALNAQLPEVRAAARADPLRGNQLGNELQNEIKKRIQQRTPEQKNYQKMSVTGGERAMGYLDHVKTLSPEEAQQFIAGEKRAGNLTPTVDKQMNFLRARGR